MKENIQNEAPEAKVPKIIESIVQVKIPTEDLSENKSSTINISTETTTETNLEFRKRPKFLSSTFTKRLHLKPIKTSIDKEVGETENWVHFFIFKVSLKIKI